MSLDVLIADQDVELAKLYCRFLSYQGFSAETAAGGLECLAMVHLDVPDVLVLDCDLPWDDASGVLACLREDGLSLPVILTTWNASQEAAHRFVVPPVVFCLHKFIPLPALLHYVRLVVNDYAGRGAFSDLEIAQKGYPTWSGNSDRPGGT